MPDAPAHAPTSPPPREPVAFASAWMARQLQDVSDDPVRFDARIAENGKVEVRLRPTPSQYPQLAGSLGRTYSSLEWLLLVAVRRHNIPVRGVMLRIDEPPGFVASAPPTPGGPARRIGRSR